MSEKTFRLWDPDQQHLLPPSLRDWLPDDHPVYMMVDVLKQLDVSAIEQRYHEKDPRGTRPYPPRLMVGLLLYGYCVGIRSSRKIEKATYEDIPFRVLAAGHQPDHTRIAEFRREHLEELEELFLQVLKICQRAGLVKLGKVALDGTKVQASASKHKAMSYERMLKEEERLEVEIAQMFEEAEQLDREEDDRYGRDSRGDELPEELSRRTDRLEKIRQARRELETEALQGRAEQVQAKADRARERATTHESEKERKRSATLAPLWNQEAQELREQVSERAGPATSPEGMPQHRPKSETDGTPRAAAQRNFTDPDSRIMEQGGQFLQAYNCQVVVDEAHQIILAQGLTNKASDNGNFGPMLRKAAANAGASPEVALADAGYWTKDAPAAAEALGTMAYIATERTGPGKKESTQPEPPPEEAGARAQMKHRLRTGEGLKRYRRRKAIVEPVHGQIKEAGGFRRFGLRGYEKVRKEWALVCTAHNLNKLFRALQTGACGGAIGG